MPAGIERLLDVLSLDSSSRFCDLGSGIGRVVLTAAMHSDAAEVVGLELSDSRLEQVGPGMMAMARGGTIHARFHVMQHVQQPC